MSRKKPETPQLRLFSLTRPAPGLDALGFLRRLSDQECFFWQAAARPGHSPHGARRIRLAGAGIASEIKAWGERRFSEIERSAASLFRDACLQSLDRGQSEDGYPPEAEPRLFGGFAFRDDFVPDYAWSAFFPAHFILPHFQLCEVDGQVWLTINALLPYDEDPAAVFDPHTGPLAQALDWRYDWLLQTRHESSQLVSASMEAGLSVRYPMDFPAWEALIDQAVRAMNSHSPDASVLQKVVLARMCEVSAAGSLDVEAALGELCQAYPDCYTYLFAPRPGYAFLGASPELLVSVQGEVLHSMALAGSIRRGRTPAEDDSLAETLLASAKDRQEHHFVAAEVRRRLVPMCAEIEFPKNPDVIRFRNIQHLYTPFSARLKRPIGVLRLAASLHPTPALGGMPRPAALEFIRQYEPLTRGWYAAPIGWLDRRLEGSFSVGIRSAVVQRERAWLYAGAGIVAASQAQAEWEETALKFRPMLQALVR